MRSSGGLPARLPGRCDRACWGILSQMQAVNEDRKQWGPFMSLQKFLERCPSRFYTAPLTLSNLIAWRVKKKNHQNQITSKVVLFLFRIGKRVEILSLRDGFQIPSGEFENQKNLSFFNAWTHIGEVFLSHAAKDVVPLQTASCIQYFSVFFHLLITYINSNQSMPETLK